MSPDAGVIARLAASVADGKAVDWNGAEADVDPAQRRLVRHLRLVESISSLYKSLPDLEATAPEEVPEGPRWGRLVLQGRIGEGTSCEVIRAFDTDLHRTVALKLLHEDGLAHRDAHERILHEARRLARVRHQHVVQVLGAEKHNDRVGLWMELVDGQSLDQMIRDRGAFGAREAAGIGQDLLSALAAVHNAKLLHRDIKAQNVMREEGGRIVLMDFGTGEELRAERGTTRLVGTPLYLAPEIFEGKPASVHTDLYSVGVLLFYLVTGEFPAPAATMEQLAAAHRDGKVRRLRDVRSDLPRPFVSAVDRALEHDPAARFQSAGEMEAALDGPTVFRAPVQVVPPARQAAQWRPAFVAMAAATVLAVAGLIVWARPWRAHVGVSNGITTVAVLPFKDVSQIPVPDLADGFTENLISALGRFTGLRVMSPPSAKAYTVNRAGLGQGNAAGAPPGADVVIEGTIVRPAERPGEQTAPARITATVRRVSNGASLWSGAFDWVPGSSESLQTAIAAAVANSLRVDAPAGPAMPVTQTNPIAEQWEMRGRIALTDYGTEGSRRAVDAFKQAVQADSNFARAHGGLSRAYVRLGQFGGMPMQEARQQALIAMRRALELDSNQADAHLASADLSFFYDWDWSRAEQEYLHALELNPSLTRARMNLAELYAAKRDFAGAFVQADQARQLDTTSEASLSYAVLLIYANRLDEADTLLDEVLRSESNDPHAYVLKGRVAEGRGEFALGYGLMEKAASLSNSGGPALQVAIAALRAKAGEVEAAKKQWQALEAQSAADTIRLSDRDRAYMKLALGDRDGAITYFERALDQRDWSLVWLTVDPRVDSLRGNPRFEAILKHIGLV